MTTIKNIKDKYIDALHQFVVGLIHDEFEADAIVAICFDFLANKLHVLSEEQIPKYLEMIARKLIINYINKEHERNSDKEKARF